MKVPTKKQTQRQEWQKCLDLDLVKKNPVLSFEDIQKLHNLFCTFSKDGKICKLNPIIKTAEMLDYQHKKSIFYKCLLSIQKEEPQKYYNFEDFLALVSNNLGNPWTELGRKKLLKLLDLQQKQILYFPDILKISDYLNLNMSPFDIQELLNSTEEENKSERSITWAQLNSLLEKKLSKKKKVIK